MRHVPSLHQSGSIRDLTEGIRFLPETFCDGFVPYGVFTRGLQFNPQALDAGQPVAVFLDMVTVRHAGSIATNGSQKQSGSGLQQLEWQSQPSTL